MRLALVCFYCLCVFVYVLYFIATMSFAGYFLSVLFCLLSMLISDSRFDLVWFRLSCDHGWIRSGSVNVRKQQQQQQQQHGGGGLELVKPAREPTSSRPKPCASLKKPPESCPFAAPCGPRREKTDRGQTSAFRSETSWFKPVILAHRGSALPRLVDDRGALRLRRIWCVPTR